MSSYNLRNRENSCDMSQPRFYLAISSSSSSCSSSQSPSPTSSFEYDPITQPLFSQQLTFESSSSDTSDDDFFIPQENSNNNTIIELEQTLTNYSPQENWFNKQTDSYMVTTRSRSRTRNGKLTSLDL